MFPPFAVWCKEVLHPQDTHPWDFRTPAFYEEYRVKYAIAKLIQPHSILEVGVRFGYAARSFLFAMPEASYIGLDFDEPSWGDFAGLPRVWAETRLHARYPHNDIRTFHFDTQKDSLTPLGLELIDMVHIDADHSYGGTTRDLATFWPLARKAVVVDDYGGIATVQLAVDEFCEDQPNVIRLAATSLRGSAILVRDGD